MDDLEDIVDYYKEVLNTLTNLENDAPDKLWKDKVDELKFLIMDENMEIIEDYEKRIAKANKEELDYMNKEYERSV